MGTEKIGSNRAAGWANASRQQRTFNGTNGEFFSHQASKQNSTGGILLKTPDRVLSFCRRWICQRSADPMLTGPFPQ